MNLRGNVWENPRKFHSVSRPEKFFKNSLSNFVLKVRDRTRREARSEK